VIVAGILHDVVEDAPVTIDTVAPKFGQRVTNVVAGASVPDKAVKDAGWLVGWKDRKAQSIDDLRCQASLDKLLVSDADKFDNARAIDLDYQTLGNDVWTTSMRARAANSGTTNCRRLCFWSEARSTATP
jgi:(p)ppGpp synthase/HD superfamily hydrolase